MAAILFRPHCVVENLPGGTYKPVYPTQHLNNVSYATNCNFYLRIIKASAELDLRVSFANVINPRLAKLLFKFQWQFSFVYISRSIPRRLVPDYQHLTVQGHQPSEVTVETCILLSMFRHQWFWISLCRPGDIFQNEPQICWHWSMSLM